MYRNMWIITAFFLAAFFKAHLVKSEENLQPAVHFDSIVELVNITNLTVGNSVHIGTNGTDGSEEIDTWIPPEKIIKDFPFYVAGYDYENRPVVVAEIGRWDVRKYVEHGEESKQLLYKYVRKFWRTVETLNSQNETEEDGITFIIDGAGFSVAQLTSVDVIQFQLSFARQGELMESRLANVLIINVNFVIQTWINLIRPVAGRWVGKAETLRANPVKVKAELIKKIPAGQLPPWYGGTSKNYKPVLIFG